MVIARSSFSARLSHWLQASLNRRARTAQRAWQVLSESLGQASEDTGPLVHSAKDPAQSWAGLAVELAGRGSPNRFEALIARLLQELPESAEVVMVAHGHPLPAMLLRQALADIPCPNTLAPSLTPGQPLRTLRSYLFVRAAQEHVLEQLRACVLAACSSSQVATRVLPAQEVVMLLAPWSADASSSHALAPEQDQVLGFLAGQPARLARHPLQHQQDFVDLDEVETLEAVHLNLLSRSKSVQAFGGSPRRLGSGLRRSVLDLLARGERPVQARATVLVKGAAPAVQKALDRQYHNFRRHGFDCTTPHLAAAAQQLAAVPWLLPLAQARSLQSPRHCEPRSAGDVARLLPPVLGDAFELHAAHSRRPLVVRDAVGRATALDFHMMPYAAHVLMLGLAGSGLTYLSNALLGAHLSGGGHAWALRWDGSPVFDDVFAVQAVTLSPQAPRSLNPLAGLRSADEFEEASGVLRAWLLGLAGVDDGSPDFAEYARAADVALHQAWQILGAGLGLAQVRIELQQEGPAGQRLDGLLRQRTSGLASQWFEGLSSLDEKAPYVSIDTSGFHHTGHEEKLALTIVALHSLAVFRMDRRVSKMLLVDEVDVLGRNEAAVLLDQALRRARRYNCQVVATNHPFSPQHSLQWRHHLVLVENCPHKLLLKMPQEDANEWHARMLQGGDLRSPLKNLNTTLQRSRFAWLDENSAETSVHELQLDQRAQAILAPNHWQVQRFKCARAEGRGIEDALLEALKPKPEPF